MVMERFMKDEQPEALIRADELEAIGTESSLARAMAAHTIRLQHAELCRLHEVNAELIEALNDLVNEVGDGFMPHKLFVDEALAALKKAGVV